MKFRCEQASLARAIGYASRATSKAGHSFIYQGMLLELDGNHLTVTGSDLDLTIQTRLEVTGFESGEVLVPAKLFVEVIRSLPPGGVDVELSEQNVVIESADNKSEFIVKAMATSDYVEVPVVEAEPVSLKTAEFVEGLKQVIPAARKDDSRPILTGVLLATKDADLRLVATDSYRLGLSYLSNLAIDVNEEDVIVPSRALDEITKLIEHSEELILRLDESTAVFDLEDITVTTRLINGEFPSYEGLIPTDHPNKLVADRSEMLDAIRRVRLVGDSDTPIRINMKEGSLTLSSTTEVGEARAIIENMSYEGEDLLIAFNAEYLNDGVKVLESEKITLLTADALKPALLQEENDKEGDKEDESDFLYLLMPVRVV